eukprot:CAMPEP_0201927210 /NCGR_PEP_ID=MMETSP0903-20130614/18175_1 /ASSEMBLY_ACC=CAM_ASM_000552 /TAXON_ID=420261 /ORGANISM="Thalassiosira antarctica, Strain CCMP982" /LENGTH=40 /DNA_ID= /DNA_START= /DNA_END= /DNA_ORIENTATION=
MGAVDVEVEALFPLLAAQESASALANASAHSANSGPRERK